ncbi:uncharacterized protein MELLADRAFT_108950 [Melampsora larici-populina 98AG31]|uniref:Uncharacterized protein n=1 Tax=Melampsora larici-populina (strain 98AG31 / pathotype 3-4-7) TaxID=747676 RepID=F4RUU6_MELLP|nr:uncharacterized protein MELLADRAFT_108950 [Melampsora larici-populina 98AG31]EGG03862.1 hypothetical protein MELLADRAFT_108950 [Melampsora larici-populina 98AG31]
MATSAALDTDGLGLHFPVLMQHPNEPERPKIYTCWLCDGKEMKDYRCHLKLANHQGRVANYRKSLLDAGANVTFNTMSQGDMNVFEGDERYQALIKSPTVDDDIDIGSILSEDSDGSDELKGEDDLSDDSWGDEILLNAIHKKDSSDDQAVYQPEPSTDTNICSVWIKMLGNCFPLSKKEDAIALVSLGGTHLRFARAI